MIRVLLSVLALVSFFALALIAGRIIADNTGYVLIVLAGWKLEMTVVSAVIFLTALVFVLWLTVKVIVTFIRVGKFSFSWFTEFGSRKTKKSFDEGVKAWFSNDLVKAQKSLEKLDGTQFDGLEFLFLADVAAKQNDTELQKQALLKASRLKNTRHTASLLLAKMHIDAGEQSSGLALLEDAQDKDALQIKLEAMASAGQWRELVTSLDKWKRQLTKQQYSHWKEQAVTGVMREVASKEGAKELAEYWENQPRKVRNEPESQAAFVRQLIEQGMHTEAESYLVKFQPKKPHPTLLPIFRDLVLKQPVESRKKLEMWLKQDDENIELLSVLGQLAFNANDHILAAKVLQKAIKLDKNNHDVLLLAKVKEAEQDNYQALQLYKQLV